MQHEPAVTPLMTFEVACAQVVAYLGEVVPMSFWSVSRHEDGRQVYLTVRDEAYGKTAGESHAWSDSFCQHMVTGATPQIAPDAMAVPQYAAAGVAQVLTIGSYVGIPIRAADGSLFGTICGLDPQVRGLDLESQAPLLRLLADLLGRILETENLREEAERRAVEQRWRASHDGLTGLPNRALFRERLLEAVEAGRRPHRPPVAVLLIDLDGFKAVNDTLGHAAGDDLLVRVGRRILDNVRAGDSVARLSGDEFAVLMADGGDPLAIADRVLASLGEPFPVSGTDLPVSVGASIGVAELTAGTGGGDIDELLARADIAMYAAKASGRGRVRRHQEDMGLPHSRDLSLRGPLRDAVAAGDIEVVYQPVVDVRTGQPLAFEALSRWEHDGVPVPPDVFIPVATRSGLLPALTAHVLETVGAQLARWSAELGHHKLRVNVNLSSAGITDRELPGAIADWARRHGVEPAQLVLEITEDALLSDLPAAREVGEALHELGVGLALDDFGTGYSSLVHLRQIPLRYLKIDRGFTHDLAVNPVTERFMGALLRLGDDLGLSVVVEGVETTSQAAVLRRLGCRLAQGYLFARPAPADAFRLGSPQPIT